MSQNETLISIVLTKWIKRWNNRRWHLQLCGWGRLLFYNSKKQYNNEQKIKRWKKEL